MVWALWNPVFLQTLFHKQIRISCLLPSDPRAVRTWWSKYTDFKIFSQNIPLSCGTPSPSILVIFVIKRGWVLYKDQRNRFPQPGYFLVWLVGPVCFQDRAGKVHQECHRASCWSKIFMFPAHSLGLWAIFLDVILGLFATWVILRGHPSTPRRTAPFDSWIHPL